MPVRDELLEKCLNDMQAGRRSAARCANEHPDVAEELLPLLLAAERCFSAPAVAPSEDFRTTARTRMLDLIEAHHAPSPARHRVHLPRLSLHFPPALTRYALAAVLIIVMAAGGTGAAAQSAPPGSPLYVTKLALEDLRITAAASGAERAEIYLDFADRRLQEMQTVSADNETAAALVMNRYRENVRLAVEAAIGSNEPERVCTEADLRLAGQQEQLKQAITEQESDGLHDGINQSLGTVQHERSNLQHHIRGSGAPGGGEHESSPTGTSYPGAKTTPAIVPDGTPSPHGWIHTDPETWQGEQHSGESETVSPGEHSGPDYREEHQTDQSGHDDNTSPAPVDGGGHNGQTDAGEHQEPGYTPPAPTSPAPMPQPTTHDSQPGAGGMHNDDSGGERREGERH